jgi:hypothetical protein
MLDVCSHRKGRRLHEPGIDPAIDDLDDLRDRRMSIANTFKDRLLTHSPMQHVRFHQPLRLENTATMTRQKDLVIAAHQAFERTKIGAHAAFRRCDDARIPAHHVITGKKQLCAFQCEAKMVRCMPRRVQGEQRKAVSFQPVSILEHDIRLEIIFDIFAA